MNPAHGLPSQQPARPAIPLARHAKHALYACVLSFPLLLVLSLWLSTADSAPWGRRALLLLTGPGAVGATLAVYAGLLYVLGRIRLAGLRNGLFVLLTLLASVLLILAASFWGALLFTR